MHVMFILSDIHICSISFPFSVNLANSDTASGDNLCPVPNFLASQSNAPAKQPLCAGHNQPGLLPHMPCHLSMRWLTMHTWQWVRLKPGLYLPHLHERKIMQNGVSVELAAMRVECVRPDFAWRCERHFPRVLTFHTALLPKVHDFRVILAKQACL